MSPAQQRALAAIQGELGRLARYDDESIVNDLWVRRRYDGGRFASYGEARRATVTTAWHEAGHAVAALAVGARFRAASRRRFGGDEFAAWRHSEQILVPHRPEIRQVARALLVHPRHIPQAV